MTQGSFRQENQKGPNTSQAGNGANININNYINASPSDTSTEKNPTEDAPDTEPHAEPTSEPTGCGVPLVIIAAIIILIIVLAVNGGEDEPQVSEPYPVGVSKELVLKPVLDKIYNCAKEPVLAPRTCLQSASSLERTSKVRWSVHGYPTDGANVHFDGQSFTIEGTAVMSVRFREWTTDRYEVHIIPYRAKVFQDAGKLLLGSIVEIDEIPSAVKKQEPALKWEDIQAQVRATFDKCASSKSAPMPPGCPDDGSQRADDATWKLESNPLLNAIKEFDETTGIIHVLGSYSIYLDGVNFFGRVQGSQSGDYDAWVIFGNAGIEVLDIRHD